MVSDMRHSRRNCWNWVPTLNHWSAGSACGIGCNEVVACWNLGCTAATAGP